MESRLLPIVRRLGLASLAALVAKLRGTGAGVQALIGEVVEAMTTNETFFYRDRTPFDNFSEAIVPALIAARAGQRRIRIWCAAASTGQEPYSLAICLKEMGARLAGWHIDILATDLSHQVLDKASAGIYSQFEVQRGLPIQYLVKYFAQKGDTWQIAPEIRAMVHRHLLLREEARPRSDIQVCSLLLPDRIDERDELPNIYGLDWALIGGGELFGHPRVGHFSCNGSRRPLPVRATPRVRGRPSRRRGWSSHRRDCIRSSRSLMPMRVSPQVARGTRRNTK
jgi:hypothetical protein